MVLLDAEVIESYGHGEVTCQFMVFPFEHLREEVPVAYLGDSSLVDFQFALLLLLSFTLFHISCLALKPSLNWVRLWT